MPACLPSCCCLATFLLTGVIQTLFALLPGNSTNIFNNVYIKYIFCSNSCRSRFTYGQTNLLFFIVLFCHTTIYRVTSNNMFAEFVKREWQALRRPERNKKAYMYMYVIKPPQTTLKQPILCFNFLSHQFTWKEEDIIRFLCGEYNS